MDQPTGPDNNYTHGGTMGRFDVKEPFPIDAFLAAQATRPSKFAGITAAVKSIEQGFTRGIQISDALSSIREKRERKQLISNLAENADFGQIATNLNVDENTARGLFQVDPVKTIGLANKGGGLNFEAIRAKKTVELEVAEEFTERKEQRSVAKKAEQAKAKTRADFAAVENVFTELTARKKAQLIETEGSGLLKGGAASVLSGPLKSDAFPATAAFDGQRTETASRLVRILTGQNRFVESLFRKISNSLPATLEPGATSINKIDQSITNAFGLAKAVTNSGIDIEQFSDDDLKDPDSVINQRLDSLTPVPLNAAEKKQVKEIVNRIIKVKPAEIRIASRVGKVFDFTEPDIKKTMAETGLSRDQVIDRLSERFDINRRVLFNALKIQDIRSK